MNGPDRGKCEERSGFREKLLDAICYRICDKKMILTVCVSFLCSYDRQFL